MIITKHQTILSDLIFPDAEDQSVLFVKPADDPTEDAVIAVEVYGLPRDLWEEMGSPDQITITVQPGDHLNVEDAS